MNNNSFILEYICNCMSGRKVAGCCVHVASVIFYLSYARHYNLKLPALNKNLVLIDTTKKQRPNKLTLVRVKRSRNKNNVLNRSETSSSDESENETTDDESDVSEGNLSETETEHESQTDESLTDVSDSD